MISCSIAEFQTENIPSGSSRSGWLSAPVGLETPASLPCLVVRGGEPGPTLLAVAGVHGNEYEGMAAIRAVATQLDAATLSGAFVAIPVANPFAYATRTRTTPPELDGLNLARVFPGDANGSPTQQLAAHLLHLAERLVGPEDLVVDFHSGSHDVAFATLVGFRDVPGPARHASETAARHFGGERLWRIPDACGPFNAETARRGLTTIATETTGRAGLDPAGVEVFTTGLFNVMVHLGMITRPASPRPLAMPALTSHEMTAPADGFLRTTSALHDRVTAGQVLGDIVSVFGTPLAEIHSEQDGELWAVRATPVVAKGELCFMVAQQVAAPVGV